MSVYTWDYLLPDGDHESPGQFIDLGGAESRAPRAVMMAEPVSFWGRLACAIGLHSLAYGEGLYVDCSRCKVLLRDQDGNRPSRGSRA